VAAVETWPKDFYMASSCNSGRRWDADRLCVFCMNVDSSMDTARQTRHLSPNYKSSRASSPGIIFPPVGASFKTQFALINRRKSILTAYDAQWRGHKSSSLFSPPRIDFQRKSRAAFAKAGCGPKDEDEDEDEDSWTTYSTAFVIICSFLAFNIPPKSAPDAFDTAKSKGQAKPCCLEKSAAEELKEGNELHSGVKWFLNFKFKPVFIFSLLFS